MKYFVPVALLWLSCLSCLGQKASQPSACFDTANTQSEMNVCASEEAKQVDIELNEIYRHLLSTVSKDPVATRKIKAAEQAWIAYRDAYLQATYPSEDKQSYGTMFPMEFDLLRAKLTQDHIKDLRDLLAQQ